RAHASIYKLTGIAMCFDVAISILRRLLAMLGILLPMTVAQESGTVGTRHREPERSYGHDQGDDHLLEPPRNTGRDPRGGPGRRNFHRTRAFARRGWQCLQGPGIESPPRHAVGVR